MKKTVFVLILIILAAAVLPVFAGAPTEYEIPTVGTEINGFKVTDVYHWESYATDVVKLEHEKTGSVLYWLANDNIDRSYMMGFNTPIYDNTGMPHVFEHATLGGSEKYPGANTFFEMTSKTSNTFLNALTGQFYTMYPMASTSEEQLLKYVDFYMSGLTAPLAIENPYAMMREAYRYELPDADSDITLQGVVYSEMLGALNQSRWASYNYNRMIWPNSYVTTVSGGDPLYIPDLTIEALREFHDTYYHPSNATMYLTGDVELPRFLELLDTEFLSKEASGYLGAHDFSAFCAAGSSVKDTVRTVSGAKFERDGNIAVFRVEADGFLYNMVRIMVGTLLDISAGKIPPGSIPEIIDSLDRNRAGFTAPAEGLFLHKIIY